MEWRLDEKTIRCSLSLSQSTTSIPKILVSMVFRNPNHILSSTFHSSTNSVTFVDNLPNRRYTVVCGDPPQLWPSPTTCHRLLRRHRRKLVFDPTPIAITVPNHTIPVDILSSTDLSLVTSIPCARPPILPPPNLFSLEQRLNNLSSWQAPLLSDLHHLCPLVDNISHISCPFGSTSEIISATNGSAKDPIAFFGWTIRLDDTDIVTCSGPVSGPNPGSYSAECLLLYLHLPTCDRPGPVPFSQM